MAGDHQAVIRGIVLIQDLAGMTLSHTLGMTPAVARKAMTVWQDAYPSRPKALHFINMPPGTAVSYTYCNPIWGLYPPTNPSSIILKI